MRDILVRLPGTTLAGAAGLTLALALPDPAGAQQAAPASSKGELNLTRTARQVTLRSPNGELNLKGKLLSFEDGVYRIDTLMGVLSVPDSAVTCDGVACPSDPRDGIPGEMVELTDDAGELQVRGTLVAFTGETYTIETAIGELKLPADAVNCTGPGCPVQLATVAAPEGSYTAEAVAAAPAQQQQAAIMPEAEAAPETDAQAEAEPQDAPEIGADVAAVPAVADPADQPAAETVAAPAPPPDASQSELIQIARLDRPADLRLAGPAPILEAISPALASGFAARLGASATPAEVEFVTPARAEQEGLPAGSMGLTLTGGPSGPVTVAGQFTSGPEPTLELLADGAADLAFATAPASLTDERLAGGLVLGSDGMVVVVAPDNPLTEIPTDALAKVFAGEITDWAELGAPEGPIRLVGLPASHAASVSLSELVLAPAGLTPRPADVVVPDVATLASIVAGDPLAIGFMNNAAHDGARALDLVTDCGLRAAPGAETFRTRRYPFTQAIVARRGGESSLAADLLDYLAGAPEVLREIGYADAEIGLQPLEADRDMLAAGLDDMREGPLHATVANALSGMEGVRRLNQVLYFERGTNRLDPQSRAALGRVLAWLADNAVGEAFIVGHAPAAGEEPDRALYAARAAADLVLQEITLSEAAPPDVVFRRLALGGLLPVVCPGDIIHAATNSRVEIWVRDKG